MDKIIHIPGFNLKVTRRLIVDLSLHFVVTLFIALSLLFFSQKTSWLVMAFIGGILIDTDHFIDYFLHLDRWNLLSFLHGHFVVSRKLYLVFHAWEIVFVLTALSLWWSFLAPLAIAMAGHLLIDTLMHARYSPLCYFLLYRWKHQFSFDKFNYYLFERQIKSLKQAGLIQEEKEKDIRTSEDQDENLIT
ncbi:MAG: hypothetical protein JW928_08550 [Candidatus Aureabacteria bacterium]|nr:hypothetical protein [Candidatus Auribacterota bacterium]